MTTATLTANATAPRRFGRSFLAVFAGVLANVVLGNGTDVILHALGVFPAWGQPMGGGLFALALAYRVVFGVAGSWLTARLAPARPVAHALALGAVGVLFSTAGALATWDKGPAFGPHWYPLALVIVTMPCAWAGARLARRSK